MKNTAVNTTSFVSTFVSGTVSAAAIVFMALLGSVQVFAQGDAAAGAEKITVCLACHGSDGNMSTLPNVPKIGGQTEKYLLKQIKWKQTV